MRHRGSILYQTASLSYVYPSRKHLSSKKWSGVQAGFRLPSHNSGFKISSRSCGPYHQRRYVPPKLKLQKDLGDVLDPLLGEREIRLVKLKRQTNQTDDRLEIDIGTWSLDHDSLPRYCALSYTWDTGLRSFAMSNRSFVVHYQGEPYPVTWNLYMALRYLRSPDADRFFWIDQLCIRQNDFVEKSRQIPLMRDIYRDAPGGVVAWLGRQDSSVPTLLQYVDWITGTQLWSNDTCNDHDRLDFSNNGDVTKGIRALIRFLSRPWFSRIWVVQEGSSQKCSLNLHFNTFSLAFSTLLAVVEYTNRLLIEANPTTSLPTGRSTYFYFLRACPTIDAVGQSGNGTLQELVQKFCNWNGTEDRDKIYAFLGLAKDRGRYPLPDYSLPTSTIYRQFATIWLQDGLTNMLTNLTFAVAANRDDDTSLASSNGEMPSWVVDWSSFSEHYPVSPLRNNYKFNAGGTVNPDASYLFDGHVLCLKGVVVDKIVSVTETLRWGLVNGSWLKQARNIVREQRLKRGLDEEGVDKDLGRLLVLDGQSSLYELCGEEDDNSSVVINEELTDVDALDQPFTFCVHGGELGNPPGVEYFDLGVSAPAAQFETPSLWPELFQSVDEGNTIDNDKRKHRSAAYRAYKDALLAINLEQRMFLTRGGRIGIGNSKVEPGSDVVIVQGARMPFIGARMEAGTLMYRLVSEAYVRGIMHGEVTGGISHWQEVEIV